MRVRYGDSLVAFDVADDSAIVRDVLVREARAQVARYPQYDGHFDETWKVARATRDLSTKGGLSFTRGDVYLARVEDDPDIGRRTVGWSRLRGVAVSVPDGVLEFVG